MGGKSCSIGSSLPIARWQDEIQPKSADQEKTRTLDLNSLAKGALAKSATNFVLADLLDHCDNLLSDEYDADWSAEFQVKRKMLLM